MFIRYLRKIKKIFEFASKKNIIKIFISKIKKFNEKTSYFELIIKKNI